MDVDDTLGFLLGRWSVRRRLVDAGGIVAVFSGTGVFTAQRGSGQPVDRLGPAVVDRLGPAVMPSEGSVVVPSEGPVMVPSEGREGHVRSAHYEETGHIVAGSYSGPATRCLEYVRRLDGRGVDVRFCDGRPFIGVDLAHGRSTDLHVCSPDDYEITTRVVGCDLVRERWRVRGPHKCYGAVTTMRRLAVLAVPVVLPVPVVPAGSVHASPGSGGRSGPAPAAPGLRVGPVAPVTR